MLICSLDFRADHGTRGPTKLYGLIFLGSQITTENFIEIGLLSRYLDIVKSVGQREIFDLMVEVDKWYKSHSEDREYPYQSFCISIGQ